MTDEIRIGVEPPPSRRRPQSDSLTAAADQNPGVWVSRVLPLGSSGNCTYYKLRGYEALTRFNGDNGIRTMFIRKPLTPKAES